MCKDRFCQISAFTTFRFPKYLKSSIFRFINILSTPCKFLYKKVILRREGDKESIYRPQNSTFAPEPPSKLVYHCLIFSSWEIAAKIQKRVDPSCWIMMMTMMMTLMMILMMTMMAMTVMITTVTILTMMTRITMMTMMTMIKLSGEKEYVVIISLWW